MNTGPTIASVFLYFATLSLFAVGGANAVLPDMHRHLVELHGWLSESEFLEIVALAQAAPGPNVLIVSLIGQKLGGLGWGLAAIAGMCLPSSLLAFGFARFWQHFEHARGRAIIRDALAPVATGLVLASGLVLVRAADHAVGTGAISLAAAALGVATRWNPLWLLGAAGVLGAAGLT
jgi:chromate transporter